MKLAVISTATNPFALVVSKDGLFKTIPGIPTLTHALQIRMSELKSAIEKDAGEVITGELMPPVAPETEVWGAGVTYLRSRDARKEESDTPDVYQRVYEADRPELFFKATCRRTVGNGDPIGIRYDSEASVPEPEVAIVVNKFREIIGFSICNDMTARTIEGENPLYLPQAKSYLGSTSLGPDITLAWLAPSAADMSIHAEIKRGSEIVWQADTALSGLNRTLPDLVDYLFRCQTFPDGVILSTGTGIIPPLEFITKEGDVILITVNGLGLLSNPVVTISADVNEAI
ncbi:MAG: fumarylacetoacetate hydrolase family protein [Actinobacteria bacterium]|nr:fumarylacetoacetate hydrolase family protein [Actinomycetota bacterium]